MKFILNEDIIPQKFILTEDDDTSMLDDIDDNTEIDYKQEILTAEKSGDKKTVESIWDAVYKKIAGIIGCEAQNLKNLGEAFRVECINLGFTESLNPFITYLKKIKGFIGSLSSQTYGTIHNNFTTSGNTGTINKNDLLGTGALGIKNVIFNQDLFSHNANDINRYLELQEKLIAWFSENPELEYEINGETKTGNLATCFSDLFIDNGKLRPVFKLEELMSLTKLDINAQAKKIIIDTSTDAGVEGLLKATGATKNKDIARLLAVQLLAKSNVSENKKEEQLNAAKITANNLALKVDAIKAVMLMSDLNKILDKRQLKNENELDKVLVSIGKILNN